MEKSWLSSELDKDLQLLASEEKPIGWFSLSAISNIPLISFPGMSKRECEEVLVQAQNVLRISRNKNNYKEVAITYSVDDDNIENKYKTVIGEISSVYIMQDEETKSLLEKENQNDNLVVISIHNHPNDGNFSVNDLFIYEKNPCIRLMEIVNRKGEVSFLYKPKHVDLKNIVLKNIIDVIPDFLQRKQNYEQNGKSLLSLSEILTLEERRQISKETIFDFQQHGVYFCQYVGKDKEDDVVFSQESTTVNIKSPLNSTIKLLSNCSFEDSEYECEREDY